MPLLGKKSFKPNPLPKDLRSAEEVFVIKETNEVFRSYDEYVNRIILYGFQVWGCQLTGKTNLKYGEAVTSEEQALKRLESFPKCLEKPILQLVHHSTCALQTLVQQCYKYLENEYVENEPVEYCVSGKWHQGRISRIHRQTTTGKKTGIRYDIECDSMQDCLKDVLSGDIKRLEKIPSEEMVSCFIRANTENPWRNDNSPWIVKADVAKKYSLLDKLNDFSLVLGKTTTPPSKNPKGTKISKKPKKGLDESALLGVSKTNLSQRKLDSFTKSIDSSNVTMSLSKLSDKVQNNFTPAKKDTVNICSSSEKGDDKTPSGQLRGTPVKCRLVLTPVKYPSKGEISRSPACKKSGFNDEGNKTKKTVVIEDDTNDAIITGCKSPKINSGNKLKKSPKSGKAQKTSGVTEQSNKKYTKEGTVSKKLDLSKSVTAKKEHVKGAGSNRTKTPKPKALVQKGELVNVESDSDKDFESSPHKPGVKPKQSSSKMKQMTLLDLAKKPDEDTVVPLSPKMKAKKQKTLSEMFSTAIPKDKPNQLMNALKLKTAQQESSSSCLALNLHTTHQALVAEKSNVDKHKLKSFRQFNKENAILNKTSWQKLEDNKVLNAKPLPLAKPVNMPTGITAEIFGDIAMIADFVYSFRHHLVPRESLHISIDNLSQALIAGNEGFPLLSKILFIFLQILLQDKSTKGQELGMQLAEMPLTQQSASEVSRLYLNSKVKMLTSYEDDKQLQGTLESLQHEDFYNLTPEEKTKILVTLCHEVLSSDAMNDYIECQLTEVIELRKQKKAKQKERNNKRREEKERRKKEKEQMLKQKEEEANKKQLKVDELSKKETGLECGNVEKVNLNPGTETSNKNVEKKITNTKTKMPVKEQSKEVSEVVKTLRKRREDMACKEEKKLKEESERLEKEEEEQWEINMAQCQYTVRLSPIGRDRNHARYWVFNGAAAGVFVEQGWWNLDNLSGTAEEPSKESREVEGDSDIEMVGEITEVETKMDTSAKVNEREWRFPDISYEWLCYSTVEEVQTLIDHLSHQGIRESALKKSLKEKLKAINDGIIRRNPYRKPTKPETGEEGVFSSIKEELKDTAERLVCGNLAVLHEGLEEYQHTVDEALTVSDLASQLEKLLPAVLPQFHQGLFSKEKKGSEEAKQRWLDAVKQATTVSRLHLLLEIMDSTVIWDLSAENARCKICRVKGLGTTLILCDDCNLGYHLQCLRPALSEVPEGHWSCPACKPNERQSSRTSAKNYKEESGSEVDDEEEASEATIDDSDESSEDESDEHEDYCHTCGEEGDLICCDSCPLVFHKDCHQPPLRNIPKGAWSCFQCRQPKSKKQKEKQRGGQITTAKQGENKVKKPGRRDERSLRSNKLKRSHSRSSEESGSETVSKRTRQSVRPIEVVDGKSARDRRRKAHASIEDVSDDESIDGKMKSKSTQHTGRVKKNGRTSSTLQRICPQVSEDEDEEEKGSKSNAKSFYGKSTGRARRRNISREEEEEKDEDEPNERYTNASKNSGRRSRRNRPQILDDSEDEHTESGKENRQSSLLKTDSRSKSSQRPARKSTRNQRQIPSSPEESDDGDEDTSKLTKQRATSKNKTSRNRSTSSSVEEPDESGHDTSKRQALRNTSHAANKSNKVSATRKTQARPGEKINGDRSDGNTVKSKRNDSKEKGKKGELRNSSATIARQKQTRDTRRTDVLPEESKRGRVNIEMDICEQIVRNLLLHEDSWPFTQAVNLREVPDYLELIATPMDLGTIKEKLKTMQYPDVDSFVSDVRLVFSNSDKYNLSTSDVGQAGKNLEKYFDRLFKENFLNTDKKSKVQRKR